MLNMAKIIDPNYPPYSQSSTLAGLLIRKESFKKEINANRIFDADQIEWYTKFSRFPILDVHNALTGTKEYLFFTKPDLNLLKNENELNDDLKNDPFFIDMLSNYKDVLYQLQLSVDPSKNPFMPILSNGVRSTLDLPEISAAEIDGPATIYGTTIKYRGTSYKSDEDFDFNLEFVDTKYLEIYLLMKTWDTYYRYRLLGQVSPNRDDYTVWKVLDDQIAIYKFVVGEDGESIIHFSKLYGCYPMNVPRNIFSDGNKTDGLNFSLNWKAQFIDDMDPLILRDFNVLVNPLINGNYTRDIPLYDKTLDAINPEWPTIPYIGIDLDAKYHKYKLKWKGAK